MIRPVPFVEAGSAYRVPRPAGPIDLKLDGNEGFEPPGSLFDVLADAALLRTYPSTATLEAALADRHGVSPDQVLVTAGADDALDRACRALLAPGRTLTLPAPTFEMLERYASYTGATVQRLPWTDAWPLDAVLETPADVIAMVTPNNPNGAVVTADDLARVVDRHPEAAILVDHAYVEFAAPELDLTAACRRLPQAMVFRTMSKAWGLAGLRVGYVIGAAEPIRWLRRVGQPYAVSGPSVAVALAALDRLPAEVDGFVATVRHHRTQLTDALVAAGYAPTPSQANFVYVPTSGDLWTGLAAEGIAVRAWPDDPVRGGAVRITVPGRAQDCDRLCTAIDAIGRIRA